MKAINKVCCCILLFIAISTFNTKIFAQNPVCAYCNTPLPNGVHSSSCPYYKPLKTTTKSGVLPLPSTNINNMVAGMVFQSLLNSLFSSNTEANKKKLEAEQQAAVLAAQKAAIQKKIQEEKEQAEYDKMMQSFKPLGGHQNLQIKSIGDSKLDFKKLDGEAETLSANARKQFDSLSIPIDSNSNSIKGGTQFFGDSMATLDLQTLEDLNNDPDVVDLRETQKYVEEKIKNDSSVIVSLLRKSELSATGEPILKKADCIEQLSRKLKVYENQRAQTLKILNLSNNELNIWETANRNALTNQVKDGLEYFAGKLFERLTKRGEAADRLQGILDKNIEQITKEGIDVTDIQAKINYLKAVSTKGQLSEIANKMNDWTTFMKDGLSSLLVDLSKSNDEINQILENPQMEKYFNKEKPELNALLDISKIAADSKVFGKWVARKVPTIALIEISIKTVYNGLDFFLSLQRIKESRKINGGAMETAKYIQNNINNTYAALSECYKN